MPESDTPTNGLLGRLFRGHPLSRIAAGVVSGALVLGGSGGRGGRAAPERWLRQPA